MVTEIIEVEGQTLTLDISRTVMNNSMLFHRDIDIENLYVQFEGQGHSGQGHRSARGQN
jgi:hypothetical protein